MCVKMQLIQLQAGYENAQVLGEKDGSQFEEESSEADDEQTGIKGEDEADETDGQSEIEFGNKISRLKKIGLENLRIKSFDKLYHQKVGKL